jgi:hypothetical protein
MVNKHMQLITQPQSLKDLFGSKYSKGKSEEEEDPPQIPPSPQSSPPSSPSSSSSSSKSNAKKHVHQHKNEMPLLKLDVKFELPIYDGEVNVDKLDNWFRQMEVYYSVQ